jgi:hypothetical protein
MFMLAKKYSRVFNTARTTDVCENYFAPELNCGVIMQTQVLTEELWWRAVEGIVDVAGLEDNETLLLHIICSNVGDSPVSFTARVKFEGIEEAQRVLSVQRTLAVVLDAVSKQPAFLFLDQTTLVECEVGADT